MISILYIKNHNNVSFSINKDIGESLNLVGSVNSL